jgi:uncharacterized protein (UPF0548 family)
MTTPSINNPRLIAINTTAQPNSRWASVRVGMTYQEILDCGIEHSRLRARVKKGALVFEEALSKVPHWKKQRAGGGRKPHQGTKFVGSKPIVRKCIGPLCCGRKTFQTWHKANHVCMRCTVAIGHMG